MNISHRGPQQVLPVNARVPSVCNAWRPATRRDATRRA